MVEIGKPSDVKGPIYPDAPLAPSQSMVNQSVEKPTVEEMNVKIDRLMASIEDEPTPKVNILHDVLRLLMEMLPLLQRIGVAQANQLNSLPTKMQAFYTKLINNVKIYTDKDQPYVDIKDAKERWDKLSTDNSKQTQIIDNLRNLRDLWANEAKKIQSGINTTNEAVNQQTDLLTTFFQQIKELTTSITRT